GAPVAAACAIPAGCNRNTAPAPAQPAQTAPAAPATAPAAPQPPPPIPAGTELPVASIDSVVLNRPQDAPKSLVIQVSGTTASAGWTNPHLAEDAEAATDPSVKTYRFVATSPEPDEQNRSPQMVEAELRIDALPPEVKSIRVLSASNEISAPVTD